MVSRGFHAHGDNNAHAHAQTGALSSSYFVNKKIKYVWDKHERSFVKLTNVDESMKQADFHKCKEGLGQLTVTDRLQEYGENLIKISVPPVLYLVFHEVRK